VFESEANEYVQGNSKSTNTAGVADLSLSRVITENQWKGWRNQQIFHTTQQSDFQYSAQVQSSCMGVDQTSHAPPRHGDPLFEVLKRQEELTSYLIQQQGNPRILPRREISVFDGDPLQYIAFIRAFEHGIEEKTDNEKDRLYFLKQFTRGQPKDLVCSCQHMAPDRGYALAKRLLQEHFGNEFKVSTAYLEKALGWPALKAEDVQGLQAYALFLHTCCNTINELSYMQELNMPINMKIVVTKLPYRLREQWTAQACEIMESRLASDPVFGDIQD